LGHLILDPILIVFSAFYYVKEDEHRLLMEFKVRV
jgi:hypothetical protein